MRPDITWLHFSDLHCGARGEDRDWPLVRDALLRDLEGLQQRAGAPDLVLFTGDLAWSGAEYDQVERFLDWLDAQVGRVPVFAVPGNHDLARPTNGRPWRWLHADDDSSAAEREDEVRASGEEVGALFAGWRRFHSRRLAPRLPGLQTGLLPGDASWTYTKGELRLGLLGLNSAWRQFSGEDFKGRVSVSPLQVHALLPDGAEAWRRDHHLCLLLQHHPPDWMDPRDRWPTHVASSAHAVLYGHMHENRAAVFREESNEDQARVQARSLFGLEHYGRASEERRFGYRWGRMALVDRGADGLATRAWTGARTLVERRNRWAFAHPESVDYDEHSGMRLLDVPVPDALRAPSRAGPPPSSPPPGRPAVPEIIDVFIAHGSSDKADAEDLHAALRARGLLPFVDSLDLPPGDDWSLLLPRALRRSRMAVVLVGSDYDERYYLRDEVATALAMARLPGSDHRVVPVYLHGFPRSPEKVPYGLRLRNGLDWPGEGGAKGVAARLQRVFEPGWVALPAPVVAQAELDRKKRYEVLCNLPGPRFGRMLLLADAPLAELPPDTVAPATRALAVVQWIEVEARARRLAFDRTLRELAPGAFE